MMKRRIACMILCLAFVFGIGVYNATQAWFVAGSSKHQYLTSGNINYLFEGSLVEEQEETTIIPGVELVETPFTIENFSNIDTQIRIKIECSYYDENNVFVEDELFDATDANAIIDITFDEEWISETDGYFYYKGTDFVVQTADSDNTEKIPVINSLKFDSYETTIYNSGKTCSVNIVFETKQADYVTWNQLAVVEIL